MIKVIHFTVIITFLASPAMADEFAIIKDSLFGTQKIEIYQTQQEALKNYSGEGRLYRMTRKEIPVKRVETRKKVEVTEYGWVIDDRKPALPATAPAQTPKAAKKKP